MTSKKLVAGAVGNEEDADNGLCRKTTRDELSGDRATIGVLAGGFSERFRFSGTTSSSTSTSIEAAYDLN